MINPYLIEKLYILEGVNSTSFNSGYQKHQKFLKRCRKSLFFSLKAWVLNKEITKLHLPSLKLIVYDFEYQCYYFIISNNCLCINYFFSNFENFKINPYLNVFHSVYHVSFTLIINLQYSILKKTSSYTLRNEF